MSAAVAASAAQPAPERQIDGARLLQHLTRAIRRYVIASPAQLDVLALWAVHTWAIGAFYITPYLHITSAQKGCAKSLLLEILDCLVAKPLRAGYVTAAALKSAVNEWHPTLLLDEVDQQMKGSKEMASILRGLLNFGAKRGTPYISSVKKSDGNFKPEKFDCFCAKALAGIGHLWETVADRSLPIRLQRRLDSEPISEFRPDDAAWHLVPLRKATESWVRAHLEEIRQARPKAPALNREADLMKPLLAIGEVAGGSGRSGRGGRCWRSAAAEPRNPVMRRWSCSPRCGRCSPMRTGSPARSLLTDCPCSRG